jgi:Domain of unknown function DUF11/Bacterial Ig domain
MDRVVNHQPNLKQTRVEHRARRGFGLLLTLVCLLLANVRVIPQTIEQTSQDGPISVKHGGIYKLGKLRIEADDLHNLPPLPRNYQALNNRGYLIAHDGVVIGPHVVRFEVKSVNDEKEFDNLRIFHAHPDPFDPQNPAWEHVTELSSPQDKPDFKTRTLVAKSNDLGVYVIAKFVGDPSKDPKADLAVSFSDVLETVRSPEPITRKINIVNKGPDLATDVGLRSSLPGPAKFVRVDAGQGKCKEFAGSVYCKLGNLKPGETATVSYVVTPEEGNASFPEEGQFMLNGAYAASSETDPNEDDNVAEASTIVLPNLNRAPRVNVESPLKDAVYVGPMDITLKATAEDPDGAISRVDFYDNELFIGSGTRVAEKTFQLTTKVSYGYHLFKVVAIDNQGREDSAFFGRIRINGHAKIKITSPRKDASYSSTRPVRMVATVKHAAGSPTKVEFRDVGGELFGEGVRGSGDQYSVVWQNVREGAFVLVVIATDAAGVQTCSPWIPFKVVDDEPRKH